MGPGEIVQTMNYNGLVGFFDQLAHAMSGVLLDEAQPLGEAQPVAAEKPNDK